MAADDEFSDDEIAEFEGIDDEQRKRVERYNNWLRKKNDGQGGSGSLSIKSAPKPSASEYNPTLSELKAWVRDPENRSILRSLADQAEALAKLPTQAASKGKKILDDAKKRFL